MPFHSSIAASKSAVEGLVKSLAAEFSLQKIRFNAIAPSLSDTNLATALLASPEKETSARKTSVTENREILKKLQKWLYFYFLILLLGLPDRLLGLWTE